MVHRRHFNSYKITTEDKSSGRPEGYNEVNFKIAKYKESSSYLPMMVALIDPASTISVFRIVFEDGQSAVKNDVNGQEAITMLQVVCGLLD